MIKIKEVSDKSFNSKDDALKFLIENKKLFIASKSEVMKKGDGFDFGGLAKEIKENADKAEHNNQDADVTTIKVVAVGNTCNYYDSHGDVSISGSWNRTVKNTKEGLHLQEHQLKFDKIIADGSDVSFAVEAKTWKEIGFDYEGATECLVMYSTIHKEDNEYMFGKYTKNKVKQHSAGLRYINMVLAVNNSADWAKEEKENWDKYYPSIVNKDDVDERGYFWAVLEQKIIEVSAVPRGSNPATPTISVESASGTSAKQDTVITTPESETKKFNVFIKI